MNTGTVQATPRETNSPCVVVCEGRRADVIGLKLLAASLRRFAPSWRVAAYLSDPLRSECSGELERINPMLSVLPYHGPENWLCKPAVLLGALQDFPDRQLFWIDTDVLVVGDLQTLTLVPSSTIVVAEESNPNDNARVASRQKLFGLAPTPPRETTISSCVIGINKSNAQLLGRWQQLMAHPAFAAEQSLAPSQRKMFLGDQEVWELVLCEDAFKQIPLRWLRNGGALIQATYTSFSPQIHLPSEPPLFTHATGGLKPWRDSSRRFAQELFPYFWQAREYLDVLSSSERTHFRERSTLSFCWRRIGGGFPTYKFARRSMRKIKDLLS